MRKKPDSSKTKGGISRRDFARQATWAAATAAILPASLFSPAEGDGAAAAPTPQQPPTQKPKLSPESEAEVEMKTKAVLHKFGSRLSKEQKADVHRLLTEGQPALERLRAYPLENSDAPATVFLPSGEPVAPRARPHSAQPTARKAKMGGRK